MANENEKARADQEDELRKVGLEPAKEADESKEDEEEAETVETEKEETEEEESEDEIDETKEPEEESDEEEDEEDLEDLEEGQSRKNVPLETYNKLRKELRDSKKIINEQIQKNKELESKLPDDFMERVDAFAKEIGVEDPEALKKIVKFMKEAVVDKNTKRLEDKLTALEQSIADSKKSAPITDEFPKEWKTFEKEFTKEYPNATEEQIEKAQKLMEELSHTEGIGGKSYKDKDGREMLDPYPLDYIYFKNKEKFSELVTDKKRKSMETTRTQKISEDRGKKDTEELTLSDNPTPVEIEKYGKASSKIIAERDSLKIRPKLNV